MRTLLLSAGLALGTAALAADEAPIQRNLVSLRLGDRMKAVEILYPPTRDWPTYKDPGGRIVRVHVERSYAKYFPDHVETIRLGLKSGRLVHIQVVFDAAETRRKPLTKLVLELALIYGEPLRRHESYAWEDSDTVLRAFDEEIPSPDGRGLEIRSSLEIVDRSVYKPY